MSAQPAHRGETVELSPAAPKVVALAAAQVLSAAQPASSRLEHGYTRIANELLDAIVAFAFTGQQYKVLLALIRKTYGWNKISDEIGLAQLRDLTGLQKTHAGRTVRELVGMKVLSCSPGKHANCLGLNKDPSLWIPPPPPKKRKERSNPVTDSATVTESVTVTKTVTGNDQSSRGAVTKTVAHQWPKQSPQKTTTKESKKEPKDIGQQDAFARATDPPETPRRVNQRDFELPDWIPADDWAEFEEMRAAKKKPFSDAARRGIVRELARLRNTGGFDPTEVLRQSINHDWISVFALKGPGSKQPGGRSSSGRHVWLSAIDHRSGIGDANEDGSYSLRKKRL